VPKGDIDGFTKPHRNSAIAMPVEEPSTASKTDMPAAFGDYDHKLIVDAALICQSGFLAAINALSPHSAI
jgi:hypothetical protein